MTSTTLQSTESNKLLISPRRFDAAIFDLDGVLTRTARVHASAWQALFNAYLAERGARGD